MYSKEINELAESANQSHSDMNLFPEFEKGRTPKALRSNFLINKEQGDWAEETVKQMINARTNSVALEYGRGNEKTAGEKGFEDFYQNYQEELVRIGKCPDILVFDDKPRKDVIEDISDVTEVPRENVVDKASLATSGLEVRSSTFLFEEYKSHNKEIIEQIQSDIGNIWDKIESFISHINPNTVEYSDRWTDYISKLKKYKNAPTGSDLPRFTNSSRIKRMLDEQLNKRQRKEFIELTEELRQKKRKIRSTEESSLSFTPKVEDLVSIKKWINKHNVDHYYVQVFYDRIFCISFKQILELLSNSEKYGKTYEFNEHTRNQLKTTIDIDLSEGQEIATLPGIPKISSKMKVGKKGRVATYNSFDSTDEYIHNISVRNDPRFLMD